jgi:hypothetical protein
MSFRKSADRFLTQAGENIAYAYCVVIFLIIVAVNYGSSFLFALAALGLLSVGCLAIFAEDLATGMLMIIGGAVVSSVVFFLQSYVKPYIWPNFQKLFADDKEYES